MIRSRYAVAVATALGIAGLLAALTLLLGGSAAGTRAEQADALARELRCPDCQGLSVADSPTESAVEIRRQIDELLAAGASPAEVRDHFVARYGDWILLAPRSPLAWVVPLAVVALGAAMLAAWLVAGRVAARKAPRRLAALSAAARKRLHDEAEALDA